jgi:hypothetical protein
MISPASCIVRATPVSGSSAPTMPPPVSNQMRPLQSDISAMRQSVSGTAADRSYDRCMAKPAGVSATTTMRLSVVAITARS